MISVFQFLLFAFMIVLMLFMMLIILLQRGKGGGLVGAFGGMGGNSAFGARSSDVFVKITVWTAIIWFVACVAGGYLFKYKGRGQSLVDDAPAASASANPGEGTTDTAADSATSAPAASGTASDAAPAAPAEGSAN